MIGLLRKSDFAESDFREFIRGVNAGQWSLQMGRISRISSAADETAQKLFMHLIEGCEEFHTTEDTRRR